MVSAVYQVTCGVTTTLSSVSVDPRPELVHQPAPRREFEVVAGQRAQHVPDHLGLGQFAVEGLVVVLVAIAHVEPISLGRKQFANLVARGEVGEHSYFHRFDVHFAIVSACSLRAPGVVK